MPSNCGPNMRFRLKLPGACLSVVLISTVSLFAQSTGVGSPNRQTLQRQDDDAEELQRVGKLTEAAGHYRAFLAEALGGLAIEYAMVPDYARAAPLFDEALALEPDSPTLLLDYARTALVLGDLDHAKTLATEFIRKYPGDHKQLAQAHQVLGRTLLKMNRDQEARKEL